MNGVFGLALLLAASASAARAPHADLRDVRRALYCVAHDPIGFSPAAWRKPVALRYSRDFRTKPGEPNIFLFVKRARGAYDMFDVVINRQDYEIANNATLKARRRADYGGDDFVEESLGGIWTHGFIAENFLRALRHRPVLLSAQLPRGQRPLCRSIATPGGFR